MKDIPSSLNDQFRWHPEAHERAHPSCLSLERQCLLRCHLLLRFVCQLVSVLETLGETRVEPFVVRLVVSLTVRAVGVWIGRRYRDDMWSRVYFPMLPHRTFLFFQPRTASFAGTSVNDTLRFQRAQFTDFAQAGTTGH